MSTGVTYDEDIPGGEVAVVDLLSEKLDTIVRVLPSELASLSISEGLEASTDPEVDLDVDVLALLIDELQGVPRVSVHVAVTLGCSTVREEDHDLMDGLRILREVVLHTKIGM